MEPLPEQTFEAMTGEQLAAELAALSGRPMAEIPTDRMDLNRLQVLGESFVRPSENANQAENGNASGPAQMMPSWASLVLGVGSTVPNEPASSAANSALNAVPWV